MTTISPVSECGGRFSPRADCNSNADACVSGACCVNGECMFETRVACDSSGGFYQGPNTPCGSGICDIGRCCMEAAEPLCDVVEAECSAASSIPFEVGVACGSPLPCEERGACSTASVGRGHPSICRGPRCRVIRAAGWLRDSRKGRACQLPFRTGGLPLSSNCYRSV